MCIRDRILGVTELLAVDLFHLSKVFIDFRLNFRRNLFTVVIIDVYKSQASHTAQAAEPIKIEKPTAR